MKGIASSLPAEWRAGLTGLILAGAAGPFAWCAQGLINPALSSYACYPGSVPREAPLPGFSWIAAESSVVVLAALLALAGAVFCWFAWRATRDENPRAPKHLLEVGEGLAPVLAICGMLINAGFLLAVMFEGSAVLAVPLCS